MFQSWRFNLRKAEEALKAEQLDEACRLLLDEKLTEFLPGKRLAARLASRLAARSRQHGQGSDWKAAWKDLAKAVQLGGETSELVQVRQDLIAAAMSSVEERLAAGDTAAALTLLDDLDRQSISRARLDLLRQVARQLSSAEKLARRGKFSDAEAQLLGAIDVAGKQAFLTARLAAVQERRQQTRPLTETLHRALAERKWGETLTTAEQLLELAPDCRIAQDARKRAWAEVGAASDKTVDPSVTIPWQPSVHSSEAEAECESGEPRYVLWVDGVGGYLVCLDAEIVLGQARPGSAVTVPIMADLSRRHAVIRRGGEGYWIEPLHSIRVNGRAVQAKVALSDGDELELGSGVRIRFRRPHALSASARLEFVSAHRTQPSADGVLLMADSCVLGPNWRNHVVCRDWSRDVVLYRHEDNLYCRAMESIEIDGRLCDGRGQLTGNSHVVGSDFSMSLEELDRCSTQSLL